MDSMFNIDDEDDSEEAPMSAEDFFKKAAEEKNNKFKNTRVKMAVVEEEVEDNY